jgi:hypothetical protein
MSRFIDKLKQVSQSEPQPMGFRRDKSASVARLMLVAEVKGGATAGLVEGADAVLLEGVAKSPPVKADLPVGIRLFNGKTGKMEGMDFVVFTPEIPAIIAGDEKTGRVMAVDASLEMGLLKALEDLPIDALFIADEGARAQVVNWQYLMLCRRLSAISDKPVLASVSPDVNQEELQMLWDAGMDGVVVAGKTTGGLKKLRLLIDGLTLPSKRKRVKARAVVPSLRETATSSIEEEEEE